LSCVIHLKGFSPNSFPKLFGKEDILIKVIAMFGKRGGNEKWGSTNAYYGFLLFWKEMQSSQMCKAQSKCAFLDPSFTINMQDYRM